MDNPFVRILFFGASLAALVAFIFSLPAPGCNGNGSGVGSEAPVTTAATPVSAASPACDESLWDHIYSPERLQIIDRCKVVFGTIVRVDPAPSDGDLHIQVALDPGQESILNRVNHEQQYGLLVVEPICQTAPAASPEAEASCGSFHQGIPIPAVGQHVKITGSWVTDTDHGWNEIHPVTSMTPIP